MLQSLMKITAFSLFPIFSVVILVSSINSIGVCIPEAKFYSKEEKIDAAVHYVFSEYPSLMNKLDYRNADEYMSLLSDCCKVGLDYVGTPGFEVNRFVGRLSDYVLVPKIPKNSVLNLSEDEINQIKNSLKDREWFVVAISNCEYP